MSALHLYPFKSAPGIAVDRLLVDEGGVVGDRRWMAVGPDGGFLSLRTHPRMALLRQRLSRDGVELSAPGRGRLSLPAADPEGHRSSFRVWFTDREGVDCGDEAAEWMSSFLGQRCRVVRAVASGTGPRVTSEGRVRSGFADASPALVIGAASLESLNDRLPEPVSMARFRPNIVVSGLDPFGEDDWGRWRIGSLVASSTGRCPRCAATLVDPETATRGDEPLRTLARFRRNADGEVEFGVNLRFESAGELSLGDRVRDTPGRRLPRPAAPATVRGRG